MGKLFGRSRKQAHDADGNVVIDLSGHVSAADARTWTDEERAAIDDFVARRRAEQRRREAERELSRLRQRHWTGERLIEEGALNMEFWEHDDADPYAVLGILPGASLEEAAAARKRIAMECHPDRLAAGIVSVEASRRMSAANSAYERLRQALRPIG
jgi:hypothetical protein